MNRTFLDASCLRVEWSEDLPVGAIARLPVHGDLAMKVRLPNPRASDHALVSAFVMLGGEHSMNAYLADEFDRDPVLQLGPWNLEVDHESAEQYTSLLATIGKAFVHGSETGVVFNLAFASRPVAKAFDITGNVYEFNQMPPPVVFSRWRFVFQGDSVDQPQVIFDVS